jgi:hypothetical protein
MLLFFFLSLFACLFSFGVFSGFFLEFFLTFDPLLMVTSPFQSLYDSEIGKQS